MQSVFLQTQILIGQLVCNAVYTFCAVLCFISYEAKGKTGWHTAVCSCVYLRGHGELVMVEVLVTLL